MEPGKLPPRFASCPVGLCYAMSPVLGLFLREFVPPYLDQVEESLLRDCRQATIWASGRVNFAGIGFWLRFVVDRRDAQNAFIALPTTLRSPTGSEFHRQLEDGLCLDELPREPRYDYADIVERLPPFSEGAVFYVQPSHPDVLTNRVERRVAPWKPDAED